MTRYDRIMAFVPAGVVGGLAIWALVSPRTLVWRVAGVPRPASPAPCGGHRHRPRLLPGAAVLVWIRPRLGASRGLGSAVFVASTLD